MISPLHTGPVADAVGVAGELGSDNDTGPAAADVHPFAVTVMLS